MDLPGGSDLNAILPLLEDPAADVAILNARWQAREPSRWSRLPDAYRCLGHRLLKLGEPLLAYDVLAEGLQHFPEDFRMRQLMSLALARSGAPERAELLLKTISREDRLDEETLGILARIHKDLWQEAAEPAERARHLGLAHRSYLEAYRLTRGYWTGINVATTALLLGDRACAMVVAGEVRQLCLQELSRMPENGDRYWPLATLGEAALILGEWVEAEEWYGRAAEIGKGRIGDLASTRRNARMLIRHLQVDGRRFEAGFHIPCVVVFSGHMIDQPGRAKPRFPPHLEEAVSAEILARLKKVGECLGYASAACGSDILFLEAMLKRKGEVHIVLPYPSELFVRDSVDTIPGADWTVRYADVCRQATEIVVVSDHKFEGGGTSYEYANLLLRGLSSIRAEQLDSELLLLAVWDGRQGDGPGGTAAMIEGWKTLGRRLELIPLEEILHRECECAELVSPGQPEAPLPDQGLPSQTGFESHIKAILFADVVNFSRLTEEEVPRFFQHFLGGVAQLISASPNGPEVKNTWGDALYFVFSSVRDAGLFALDLSDLAQETDWLEKGLRRDLNLRIGLHVGPVYGCVDPVTLQYTYTGTHVSRTARIEPIAPPGKVYASRAFAALAAEGGDMGFKCEYVGQTPLPKGFGIHPAFHVRRRTR